MISTEPTSVPSRQTGSSANQLRPAVSAYLARFKGSSREHTESDLRCYLAWGAERGLDPLAAQRPQVELYIRWMQETRRFKPSTISRRFSVAAGFYRTCVIDGVLEHSPAEHVRRPTVPAESPILSSKNALICRGQGRALRARQGLWPCRAVSREPWTPPAEDAADGEARHGEQPEPLRARANTRRSGRLSDCRLGGASRARTW